KGRLRPWRVTWISAIRTAKKIDPSQTVARQPEGDYHAQTSMVAIRHPGRRYDGLNASGRWLPHGGAAGRPGTRCRCPAACVKDHRYQDHPTAPARIRL